jgi:CRP-like cAMP-binding protein
MPLTLLGLIDAAGGQFAPAGSGAWYCKRRQLLRELPPRATRLLEARARMRSFHSRDLLFTSEETVGIVHLVVGGRVRLCRFDADGGETQLAILEPGEAFREPRHGEVEEIRLFAEALTRGELLSVDLAGLRELIELDPESFATLGAALV